MSALTFWTTGFRGCLERDRVTSTTWYTYMFEYDSTYGKFKGTVKMENGKLVTKGKAITIFQEQDPANIKWGDAGARCLIESTGTFTIMEKAMAHLKAEIQGVIISTPSADPSYV